MSAYRRFDAYPKSGAGDFYVENYCCTMCGIPQVVAPELIGGDADSGEHCYWKKQPKTADEFSKAVLVFEAQELGCHRYGGRDPELQRLIGIENCDHPLDDFGNGLRRIGSMLTRERSDPRYPKFESIEGSWIAAVLSKYFGKK